MQQRIKWANGSATKDTVLVGPRHDPYSRTIVRVNLKGYVYTLVQCGLAGNYMILPNARGQIGCEEFFFDSGKQLESLLTYNAAVKEHTGFAPDFWFHKLWHKLEEKRDPGLQAMLYADMRLLSYAE